MEQREVDVALEVRREPGLERGGAVGFALAVDAAEGVERADKNDEVGDGDAEHHPVDGVEGPHGCGGAQSGRLGVGVRWAQAGVVVNRLG